MNDICYNISYPWSLILYCQCRDILYYFVEIPVRYFLEDLISTDESS